MSKFLLPTLLNSQKVIYSKCQNVFYNLALEDWIAKNVKFVDNIEHNQHAELMILWRNKPCVVLGRHQNAWVEAEVNEMKQNGVLLARRRSGGGCVYHDLGNINITFFTSKNFYNRKRNLNFISEHLKKVWDLDVNVNCRDDLLFKDKYKISGSAAKLGRDFAYHHFTLLINAKLENAKKFLAVSKDGMFTKATSSVPSPITNLSYHNSINTDLLIENLIKEYSKSNLKLDELTVDPKDSSQFKGIEEMVLELKDWSWVYGHSPKFCITQSFSISSQRSISVQIEIDKGVIKNIEAAEDSNGHDPIIFEVNRMLNGVKFKQDELTRLLNSGNFKEKNLYYNILSHLISIC